MSPPTHTHIHHPDSWPIPFYRYPPTYPFPLLFWGKLHTYRISFISYSACIYKRLLNDITTIACHSCIWEINCFYALFELDLGLHCLLGKRRPQPKGRGKLRSSLLSFFPGHGSWRQKSGFRGCQEWFRSWVIFTPPLLSPRGSSGKESARWR